MSSETYNYAYTLSENLSTGAFTTTAQIDGTPKIADPQTTGLMFGDPFQYTNSAGTTTLLYDGAVYENGVDIGFAGVDPATGAVYLFSDNSIPAGTVLTIDTSVPTTICFMQGTAIATPTGDRSVETLVAGDVVATSDGGMRSVKWIGRQSVQPGQDVPRHVMPVRIRAGALGNNLPVRDLLVSPDHALLVDGVLIHAAALVNGGSITAEAQVTGGFTYYHIEVQDHALVLAEGVACETYVDRAARAGFDNADEYLEGGTIRHMDVPRVKSPRQLPYAVRARLAPQAAIAA